ncbi:DDE family endonuclease domain protein [Leptospira noguchii str. Bonito]|nr:DDE family endonuclease domain protein [Leptospira noguchii str. Bonito]
MLLKENRKKILLVWDNLSVHKSKAVNVFLQQHTKRLRVEFLPPYAPELNPQEYIWRRWKRNDMANFCPVNLNSLFNRTKYTLRKLISTTFCFENCSRQAGIWVIIFIGISSK